MRISNVVFVRQVFYRRIAIDSLYLGQFRAAQVISILLFVIIGWNDI